MKDVLAAAKAGAWKRSPDGAVEVAGQRIEPDEYELRFQRQGRPRRRRASTAPPASSCSTPRSTPALEREGLARDFIRLVQVARKDAGFNVADRIHIEVKAGDAANAAIAAHLDTVKQRDAGASRSTLTRPRPAGYVSDAKLGDEPIAIGVQVAG